MLIQMYDETSPAQDNQTPSSQHESGSVRAAGLLASSSRAAEETGRSLPFSSRDLLLPHHRPDFFNRCNYIQDRTLPQSAGSCQKPTPNPLTRVHL